jgi:MFS family permease
MPLYFQAVKEYSVIVSGVAILPSLVAVAASAAITGFAIRKTGSYRKILWIGWILALLAGGIMLRLDLNTTIPQWVFTNLVGCIGIGILLPVMRVAIQASAADKDVAFAAAMTMTFRVLGMSLSLAILGIIFQNVFEQKLGASSYSGPTGGLAQNVLAVVELIKQLPSESPDKLILRQVLAKSLKMIWATLIAFNAVSLISSFFTRKLSLERVLVTEQGVNKGPSYALESNAVARTEHNGMKGADHITASDMVESSIGAKMEDDGLKSSGHATGNAVEKTDLDIEIKH